MKKTFFTFLLLWGTMMAHPYHSKELSTPLQRIDAFEESRELLSKVEMEGPLTIQTSSLGTNASNAVWMPSERTIYLNISYRPTEGKFIRSILFELHNALSQNDFNYYDQLAREGRISKDNYIEAIERIEHKNALKTVDMINKGIKKGVFPRDAAWDIAPSFAEHFHIQKMGGHSLSIGYTYDNLTRNQTKTHSRTVVRKW